MHSQFRGGLELKGKASNPGLQIERFVRVEDDSFARRVAITEAAGNTWETRGGYRDKDGNRHRTLAYDPRAFGLFVIGEDNTESVRLVAAHGCYEGAPTGGDDLSQERLLLRGYLGDTMVNAAVQRSTGEGTLQIGQMAGVILGQDETNYLMSLTMNQGLVAAA